MLLISWKPNSIPAISNLQRGIYVRHVLDKLRVTLTWGPQGTIWDVNE